MFGGILPPQGLSAVDALEYVRDFYRNMVLALHEGEAAKRATNLEQRLLDLETHGVPIYGIALRGPANILRSLQMDTHADFASFTDRERAIPAKYIEYPKPTRPRAESVESAETTIVEGDAAWSPAYGVATTYTDHEGWRCIYNEFTWLGTSVLEFASNEGYEHDFVTNNYDGLHWAAGLRGTSGLGWESNLPNAYLDYATIDDDPEEPVYTVGTFTGNQLYSNTDYYTFIRAYPGNASSDTAKLVGQPFSDLS